MVRVHEWGLAVPTVNELDATLEMSLLVALQIITKPLWGFISCSKKPGKLLVPRHKGLYGYQNSPCVVNNISNVEITKPQSKPKVRFDGIY